MAYPKLSDLKVGDILIPDYGFTCLKEGREYPVLSNDTVLYVECSLGTHYLNGHENDLGEVVGFELKNAE